MGIANRKREQLLRTMMRSSTLLVALCVALAAQHAHALMFYLPAAIEKCFSDEYAYDVLVSGEFRVTTPGIENTKRLKLLITDNSGNIVYDNKGEQSGKFGFTTALAGEYKFCLTDEWRGGSDRSADRLIELIVHSGVEAQDYSAIAKKEHLKPLELELRRIEDTVEMIQKDFEYMRDREAVMRDTNESTFTRVSYLSLFSVGCLVALAVWQLFYLKRYFTQKKLL